jgi:hypothetical protein
LDESASQILLATNATPKPTHLRSVVTITKELVTLPLQPGFLTLSALAQVKYFEPQVQII